jgi:uncharacterized protein YijF (DUF1287 family)
MKRALWIAALVLLLLGVWAVVRRVAPGAIEYRGESFRLTKQYLTYDGYKNDPDNIHPDEIGRVQDLVSTTPVPERFSSWREAVFATGDLAFPGYGSGSLRTSSWDDLRGMAIEIPRADSERVFLFRHDGDDRWSLVADFIGPPSVVASEVQEREGRFIFVLRGEEVFVWPASPEAGAERSADDFAARLVEAAMERLSHRVTYDGSYRGIDYPNGDVPDHLGVCTDLVVRAYRGVGIDLQRAVHEDMTADFDAYPDTWGLDRPDSNIDHRRVPNLQVFFERNGVVLPASREADDYRPGDLVTWMLPGNLPHIGIVSARRSSGGLRPLIVHNIGAGPALEDMLFEYPITGHYRFDGAD